MGGTYERLGEAPQNKKWLTMQGANARCRSTPFGGALACCLCTLGVGVLEAPWKWGPTGGRTVAPPPSFAPPLKGKQPWGGDGEERAMGEASRNRQNGGGKRQSEGRCQGKRQNGAEGLGWTRGRVWLGLWGGGVDQWWGLALDAGGPPTSRELPLLQGVASPNERLTRHLCPKVSLLVYN